MQFDGDLAEIRFGAGLSPLVRPPASAEVILGRLQGADEMAVRFPVSRFDDAFARAKEFRRLRRERKRLEGQQGYEAADKAFSAYRRAHNAARIKWHGQRLLRHVYTRDAFRERLVLFWADHFTAQGKNGALRILAAPYAE
ncbi:DUF1800 family protein, partial [Leisingera sp. F5]